MAICAGQFQAFWSENIMMEVPVLTVSFDGLSRFDLPKVLIDCKQLYLGLLQSLAMECQ